MSQERFNELKQKGWKNLDGTERKEFQELRAQFGDSDESPDVKVEDKITLTKAELDKLVNDAASAAVKSQPRQPARLGEWSKVEEGKRAYQTATLRVYRATTKDKPQIVIRCDYLKTIWNEETHRYDKVIMEIEVMDSEGKTTVFEMDSRDWVKIKEVERVELIHNDRTMERKVDEVIQIPTRDKSGYPIRNLNQGGGAFGDVADSAGSMELEVIRYNEVFTVRRKSGQTFKINAIYLNS